MLVKTGLKSLYSTAIGARNLYADSDLSYPRPALEDVLHRNPDVILVLTMGADDASFRRSLLKWRSHKKLNAIREGRAKILKGDTVVRPTLRLLEGMSLLEQAIFGDKQATQAFRTSRKGN